MPNYADKTFDEIVRKRTSENARSGASLSRGLAGYNPDKPGPGRPPEELYNAKSKARGIFDEIQGLGVRARGGAFAGALRSGAFDVLNRQNKLELLKRLPLSQQRAGASALYAGDRSLDVDVTNDTVLPQRRLDKEEREGISYQSLFPSLFGESRGYAHGGKIWDGREGGEAPIGPPGVDTVPAVTQSGEVMLDSRPGAQEYVLTPEMVEMLGGAKALDTLRLAVHDFKETEERRGEEEPKGMADGGPLKEDRFERLYPGLRYAPTTSAGNLVVKESVPEVRLVEKPERFEKNPRLAPLYGQTETRRRTEEAPASPSPIIQTETGPESKARYEAQVRAAGGQVLGDGRYELIADNPVSGANLARQVRTAGGPNYDAFSAENVARAREQAQSYKQGTGYDSGRQAEDVRVAGDLRAAETFRSLPTNSRGRMPNYIADALGAPYAAPTNDAQLFDIAQRLTRRREEQAGLGAQADRETELAKARIAAQGKEKTPTVERRYEEIDPDTGNVTTTTVKEETEDAPRLAPRALAPVASMPKAVSQKIAILQTLPPGKFRDEKVAEFRRDYGDYASYLDSILGE